MQTRAMQNYRFRRPDKRVPVHKTVNAATKNLLNKERVSQLQSKSVAVQLICKSLFSLFMPASRTVVAENPIQCQPRAPPSRSL